MLKLLREFINQTGFAVSVAHPCGFSTGIPGKKSSVAEFIDLILDLGDKVTPA